MRVVVITPPAPVVTLYQVKQHLRVDSDDDDALIDVLTDAAISHIDGPDGWLGRAIGKQILEARFDVFRDAMKLPYGPVLDILSVKHLDGDGEEVTLLPAEYELRGWLLGSAFGRRWPSVGAHSEAVRVQYRAGYESSRVPPAITAAILLMIGDLYRNPSSVTAGAVSKVPMTTTVENLLMPFRVWR